MQVILTIIIKEKIALQVSFIQIKLTLDIITKFLEVQENTKNEKKQLHNRKPRNYIIGKLT